MCWKCGIVDSSSLLQEVNIVMKTKLDWIGDICVLGWDLDGTLYPPDAIPSQLVHEEMMVVLMEKYGWQKDQAEREFLRAKQKAASSTAALTQLGIDGSTFFYQLWDRLPLEKYIRPNSAITRLLTDLSQAAYLHYLVSNSNSIVHIERKLSLVGLSPSMFESIVSTADLGVTKPDPRPYLVGLAQLNKKRTSFFQPTQVLYIGDRFEVDIVGAHAAGLYGCLVGSENDQADITISSVLALRTLLL